jgi:hypothetical protein
MNDYRSRLNQVETTLAEIRAETVDTISRLVTHQSRIDAVDISLANLDSQCLELECLLEELLFDHAESPELL